MARRRDPPAGPRLSFIGDDGFELYAVATDLLGWPAVAVGGQATAELDSARAAPHHDVDEIVASIDHDVAIVGTPSSRRIADAITLVRRGVHAIVVPGDDGDHDALLAADRASPATVVAAVPLVHAPTAAAWRHRLGAVRRIDHLSGRVSTVPNALVGEAITLLAAGAATAGIGLPESATRGADHVDIAFSTARARLDIDDTHDRPVLSVQAAGPSDALVAELVPNPSLEHNGERVDVKGGDAHPAERFGAAPLLRRFVADVGAARAPEFGAAWLAQLARLTRGGPDPTVRVS